MLKPNPDLLAKHTRRITYFWVVLVLALLSPQIITVTAFVLEPSTANFLYAYIMSLEVHRFLALNIWWFVTGTVVYQVVSWAASIEQTE